jgi:hypothetical protein
LAEIKEETETTQLASAKDNEAATAELKQELATIQTAAETAQTKVEELAATLEETFEKEQAERDKTAKASWTETRQEIQDQADELVADLQRMRSDAQGLVGAVSVATTANHYNTDANRERLAYWALLAFTVLVLGAAVMIAARAASHPDLEMQQLIARLGVSSGLVVLGVFTSRRATDHREREKEARDKEGDMRVFGPFIEPLPPKEQIQERILMARRFFGRQSSEQPEQLSDEEKLLLSTDDEIEIHAKDQRQRLRDRTRSAKS